MNLIYLLLHNLSWILENDCAKNNLRFSRVFFAKLTAEPE